MDGTWLTSQCSEMLRKIWPPRPSRLLLTVFAVSCWLAFHATHKEIGGSNFLNLVDPARKWAFPQSEVDEDWVEERKRLLSDPTRPTKVLLMTYMRGGSSFLGELFNQHQGAIYWYEAAAQFYSRNFATLPEVFPMHVGHYENGTKRNVTIEEKAALSRYFQRLFSCDFENATEARMAHHFLGLARSTKPFYQCLPKHGKGGVCGRLPLVSRCAETYNECFHSLTLARSCLKGSPVTGNCSSAYLKPFLTHEKCFEKLEPRVKKCLPHIQSTCEKAKIQSAKVHRVAWETLENVIKDMPDIHIIHYTRDPRGILDSRSRAGLRPFYFLFKAAEGKPEKAAKYFCPKMLRDLETVKKYKVKYPGAILTMAYEELAAEPFKNLQKVYSFIGQEPPENVRAFLQQATSARKENGEQGTARRNATATSLKWRERLGQGKIEIIDNACSEVYRELELMSEVRRYGNNQTHPTQYL